MSLRARLTVAFVVIVALPLLVMALVLGLTVPHAADQRIRTATRDAAGVVAARLDASCQRARAAAVALAAQSASARTAVDAVRHATGVDGAVVVGFSGAVEASSLPARAPSGSVTAVIAAADCQQGSASATGLIVARVQITGPAATGNKPRGTAIAAISLLPLGTVAGSLPALVAGTTADVTLLAANRPVLGTRTGSAGAAFARHFIAGRSGPASGSLSGGAPGGAPGTVSTVGSYVAVALPLQVGAQLIVSRYEPGHARFYLLLILGALVALGLGFLAGWQLARRATQPLADFAVAVRKVAAGDLATVLHERKGTEVGEVGAAFNHMSQTLALTMTNLRDTNDELRRGVGRLGSTLSGTHDLERILSVILDTAMGSVRAQAGALLLTAATRDSLYLSVSQHLDGRLDGDPHGWRVAATPTTNAKSGDEALPAVSSTFGQPGVIARIASTGQIVYGVVGDDLQLAPDEPRAGTVLGLPLRSAGRITGVLCVYDRADGNPFSENDVELVRDFISQATVAIDNVLMHQEAQRLSITDGLTGLWNYRYGASALDREVERAQRFGHSLSVLMLDLDRFKRINDRYGHQRGDAVLIELAARVRTEVREVDIVARYGGEELLLILPETDLAGARLLSSRILEGIRADPIGGPGEEPVWMTTSIGIAVLPEHGTNARTLLRAADAALYAAKAGGRDTSRVAATPPPGPPGPPGTPGPPGPPPDRERIDSGLERT